MKNTTFAFLIITLAASSQAQAASFVGGCDNGKDLLCKSKASDYVYPGIVLDFAQADQGVMKAGPVMASNAPGLSDLSADTAQRPISVIDGNLSGGGLLQSAESGNTSSFGRLIAEFGNEMNTITANASGSLAIFQERGNSESQTERKRGKPNGNSDVPLPAGFLLLLTGLGGMTFLRRRKQSR